MSVLIPFYIVLLLYSISLFSRLFIFAFSFFFCLSHFKIFSLAFTSSRIVPLSSYSWGLLVGSIPTISSYNNTCWSECWLFCEYHHVITVFPLLWNFTCFAVWKIVYPTLYLGYYHGVFPHEVALRGELSTRLIKGVCSWNFHLRVIPLSVLRNFSTFLYRKRKGLSVLWIFLLFCTVL